MGVLEAGGAFVPLDCEHPEGHLRAVMQPLEASVIFCSVATLEQAARLATRPVLVNSQSLNTVGNAGGSQWSDESKVQVQPSDLAYGIFTSGTIRHQATSGELRLDSSTRSLDSSSYAFDACVFNFFYTASQGGCLCIPDASSLKGNLLGFMQDFNVNWAQLVPSVARTLPPAQLPLLKTLVLTGEPLTPSDVPSWSPHVHLRNLYGPTECTILCAISPKLSNPHCAAHIGRGLGANLWLTDVDDPSRLAPPGGVGETVIEGPIIGAGYTSSVEYPLLVNPRWLRNGSRAHNGRTGTLYRTGDLGRYATSGVLEFLGRIGAQTKLRGQRMDVHVIEDHVRRQAPSGWETAVEIVQYDGDRQVLLLFVTAQQTTDLHEPSGVGMTNALREWSLQLHRSMADVLPLYSQPEALMALQSMPKTHSGKVDRRRLREIARLQPLRDLLWIGSENSGRPDSSPLTGLLEESLASLWAEVLSLDRAAFNREDSFFGQGGDSLGVMRLVTLAHHRGFSIKAADVFKTPKLADLAKLLTPADQNGKERMPYQPFDLVRPSLITSVNLLINECILPALNAPRNQIEDAVPVNGFQVDCINYTDEPLGLQYAYLDITPDISWSRLITACEKVVQSFQCLRARFVEYQGKYFQIILRRPPLQTEEIQITGQMTTFSKQWCPMDARRARISDVLTKLTLLRNDAETSRRVIFRISHLQNDGRCTQGIFEAIATAYNGGELAPTTEWTHLLRYRAQTAAESRNYWRSILQGILQPTPQLIYKPEVATRERTLRTISLPAFQDRADNRRTRPTVVINVAWALTLQRFTECKDVVFGNVTTGRHGSLPGLHSVVGPSVNMLPMRLQLDLHPTAEGRAQYLCNLVEQSAQQVDDRTIFEGLDWRTWCRNVLHGLPARASLLQCTFATCLLSRNCALRATDRVRKIKVAWYELVARPQWTTILVHPEAGLLRLGLLADPSEVGSDGADELLLMIAQHVREIMEAMREGN